MILTQVRADRAWARAAIRMYARRHGTTVQFSPSAVAVRRGREEIRIPPKRLAYVRDLILHFDAYHSVVEADANGVVDYSAPRVHRYKKTGVSFHLPFLAEEEDAIATYFRTYRPKSGDVVLDIGAHAGVSTYLLSQAVGPTGAVLAFEPDPVAWTSLQRNIASLEMNNVRPIQKAVAGKAGRLDFQAEGALGSALSGVSSRSNTQELVQVDAITLEQACALAPAPPAFIKMDIEGAELEVLGSSVELLRKFPIHFVVDTNHNVDGSFTDTRVEAIFRAAGVRERVIGGLWVLHDMGVSSLAWHLT
jgi:FkbM family methyltransferase